MADKVKKQMPKGGRKGGTMYPRISLAKAMEYSHKLVSKTHTGAMATPLALTGVFGSQGTAGRVRLSALKQFGLLEAKSGGIRASEAARTLDGAPEGERGPHLGKAFLLPRLFRLLYETFHGDTVSRAKLKQQALTLKVHPDVADDCIANFISSAVTAGLGKETPEGLALEQLTVRSEAAPYLKDAQVNDEEVEEDSEGEKGDTTATDPTGASDSRNVGAALQPQLDNKTAPSAEFPQGQTPNGPVATRAAFQVHVTLDSSLDIDKLEKQLQLLRRYGAL
jgi:hypothetical protein